MKKNTPLSLPSSLTVLGATGSVGRQALEVARLHHIRVDCLTANTDVTVMERLAREFQPTVCVMADEASAHDLALRLSDTGIPVRGGSASIPEVIDECHSPIVINAILGAAGLEPTLAAIRTGCRLALANKESLVIAGEIVMREAEKHSCEIIPVDSEHSAIFQCLRAGHPREVRRILLTASGGPFLGRSREELHRVTLAETLSHPTWRMGAKISVDSATMMNKGFEVIEAVHLFGVTPLQIEVVVHPESIIHSAVEYIDSVVVAQMSVPDMRLCVQYALTYPERTTGCTPALDLFRVGKLTFRTPDAEAFPLLPLAFDAIRAGGAMPAVLNAANEVAVSAFLAKKIPFWRISDIVGETAANLSRLSSVRSLKRIWDADREARETATAYLKPKGK